MGKKSKETVAIFSGYSLPHLGGIERYTYNLSNQLLKLNYGIINISSNYNFDGNWIVKDKEKDVLYLKLPVMKIFVSRYPIIIKNSKYKEVMSKLKNYNVKAIIVNTRFHLTSLVGAKYGKKHNIPVFLIEHGSQHLTVDNKVLDFFGAIYEHCLTAIIKKYVNYYYGVSKEACKWQQHFGIKSDGVWYNSINDFSKGIKLCKNKNGCINILYAGRILKQKGIVDLLNSFVKLSKKYTNIYLNIAGDGNLLDFCKKKYNSDRIRFLGKVDFTMLKELYAYTDIFVYAPNWPEGLPTSILEAGLMKCAVIASPQGGIKEVIFDNETGLLINTESELAIALERLIKNKKMRNKLSEKLNKEIQNNFLWDKTAKKVITDIVDHTDK